MRVFVAAVVLVFAAVEVGLLAPPPVEATPIYSVRSANRCDTCHIEPTGWYESPEKKDRACTLDCQACHVNRSGSGLRNSYGRYYGDTTLPMFSLDARPSQFADPSKYADSNEIPGPGKYSLFDGFSGWAAGKTPIHEIKDRTGDIDPDPSFRAGFDARFLLLVPGEGDTAFFPMQLDAHAWGQITENLNAYGTLGLQGRRARTVEDVNVGSEFEDLVTLRELALEYDGVPYNGYVRAGRFIKPYGWRHPDHTLFTRNALDVGQYSQVYGVEAGINPNYPYARVALFTQGIDSIPGDLSRPASGASATFGIRELGYTIGGSVETLFLGDGGGTEITAGPLFGVNLYPLTIIGEIDYRTTMPDSGDSFASLVTFVEANYLITQGVSALLYYTWARTDLSTAETEVARFTGGLQWDVLPSVQLAAQMRANFAQGSYENREILLWTHLWY